MPTVEMKFKTDQINDLLKSMVVQDLDGGQISTVNYGSKDPNHKNAEDFFRRSDRKSHPGPTLRSDPRRAGRTRGPQQTRRR